MRVTFLSWPTGVTSTRSTSPLQPLELRVFKVLLFLRLSGQDPSASLASTLRKSVTTAPVENSSSARSCKSRLKFFCGTRGCVWPRLLLQFPSLRSGCLSDPPVWTLPLLRPSPRPKLLQNKHRTRCHPPSNRRYAFTGHLDLDLTPTGSRACPRCLFFIFFFTVILQQSVILKRTVSAASGSLLLAQSDPVASSNLSHHVMKLSVQTLGLDGNHSHFLPTSIHQRSPSLHPPLPSPSLTRLLVPYHSLLISINRLAPPPFAGICSPCVHRADVSDSLVIPSSTSRQSASTPPPPGTPSSPPPPPPPPTRRLDSPSICAVPPKDFMTRAARLAEREGRAGGE